MHAISAIVASLLPISPLPLTTVAEISGSVKAHRTCDPIWIPAESDLLAVRRTFTTGVKRF
jgi:hypothetical protein